MSPDEKEHIKNGGDIKKKNDEIDFNNAEMKQAWAFLGLIVLVVVLLVITICICCVFERSSKADGYTKEQTEFLDQEKLKLDAQKQKVDNLTKTLDELTKEYEEQKKRNENEKK